MFGRERAFTFTIARPCGRALRAGMEIGESMEEVVRKVVKKHDVKAKLVKLSNRSALTELEMKGKQVSISIDVRPEDVFEIQQEVDNAVDG